MKQLKERQWALVREEMAKIPSKSTEPGKNSTPSPNFQKEIGLLTC
jgi:hypothetical protein